MNTDFKDFPSLFGEVIALIQNEYRPNLPIYEYGTYFELMQKCTQKDRNQQVKYPLIWLVWDQNENNMAWIDPYIYSISARIYLCAPVKLDDSTQQRYKNTIRPVLYPIFDLLAELIQHHPNICCGDDFKYPVKDHPFWLNNEAGNFDNLSAIECQLQNLTIYKD